MKRKIGMLLCISAVGLSLHGATTINDNNKYAYSANGGWVDWQGDTSSGAAIGELYCTGFIYSANFGWISLGSGPTNGSYYSNAAADDFGVNHDGGMLSGYAYGANIGWIAFETNGNPRVDLSTGNLSGYAYGANVGWIGLSNGFAYVQTDTLDTGPDTDGDGIPDAWEYDEVGDLATLSNTNDLDGDGVLDHLEYGADTDPNDSAEYLWIAKVDLGDGTNSIVSWPSQPARNYLLEQVGTPTNDANWADTGVYSGLGTGGTVSGVVVNADGTAQTYRVRAEVPLQ